jgi:predicted ABC-type ATPase
MPNDILLNILFTTKQELEKTLNLTDEEIQKQAIEYFKRNKKRIINTFIINQTDKQKLYLTAGSSGAGKSEFVTSLNNKNNLNIIDTYEIRKLFPYYSGQNADLFQKASIKTVEVLIDYSFKNSLSFILDTNLANINRALKRDYQIEIFYIFREYQNCKDMTKIREKKEGRVVGDEVFNKKAIGSLETFKQLLKEYKNNDSINFTIIDLEDDIIISKKDNLKIDTKLNHYTKKLDKYLNKEINNE